MGMQDDPTSVRRPELQLRAALLQAPELEEPVKFRITHPLSMTDAERRQMEEEVRRRNEQSQQDAAAKRG